MKENTFVVTVNKDGQYNTKMYSEEDYNTKVVPFLSEHYTPDQYSVAGLQDTTAENIKEDGQYLVSVDADGRTQRKAYTGKELLEGKLATIGQRFPDYRIQYVDGAVRPAEASDEIIAIPWRKQVDTSMTQLRDSIGQTMQSVNQTAEDIKGTSFLDLVKERGDAMANFANMAMYNGLTKTPEELEQMHQEELALREQKKKEEKDRKDLLDINNQLEDVNSQLAEWVGHESEIEDYYGEHMEWIVNNAARKDELLTKKAELIEKQLANPFYKKEDKRLNDIADDVLKDAYKAMADLSVEGDLITPNNPDTDIWQAARYFADKAKTTLSAPDDNANGFVSFLKGHGATFSDADFWLAGLESISSNMKVKKVFDTISSKLASYADQNIGKELTDGDLDYLLSDAEKKLLLSFVTASEAEALRAQNTNNMYKAGVTSANSLGFMAQFILTGGVGDAFAAGTKGAAKGLASWLAKNTGKVGAKAASVASKAGATLVGRGAAAATDAVVTPILKSIPMTLMQTGLYKDYAQKLTERDEAGNLKYDYDTALLPALRDAGLEVWSEMALEPVLGVFGKTMGIGLDKLAGKSRLAAFMKTKVDDLATFFHNREAMDILTKAGFDGYFEEIGEEILGAGVSSLWEPEAWSQFWEKDNLASMAVAFAPMSIIGGGMSMANYVKRDMIYDEVAPSVQEMLARRGALTEGQISALFNRDVSTMQDIADKISGIVNPIIASGNITADEFKALWDFAGATAQKDIANALVRRLEEDRRTTMRNEMNVRMNGKQYTGKDAEGNETISYYVDDKGNRRFVVVDAGNTDGLSLSMDENGKDLRIVNVGELELTTMGANAFFDNMWKEQQAAQESERMRNDAAQLRHSVAQALNSGKPVLMYNPQTNERENYIYLGWNGDVAVMANAKTGVEEERTIQELANALNISGAVQTDAQQEQAQIDESRKNDSIARSANDYKGAPVSFNGVNGTLLRVSSRGDENGNPSLVASIITSSGELVPVNVTANMVEDFIKERKELVASGNAAAADRRARDHERKEQQRKDSEQYRSSRAKYENPDGTVREGEFLENDPRGFAMYSDGKYGKSDTDATLAAALAKAQAKAQDALMAKEAEANPDVKAGLRDQYDRAVAALDTLDTLLNERHQDESSNGELAPDAARAKYEEYESLGLSDAEIYELAMNSINEARERAAALPVPTVSTDVQSYMDEKKKYSEAVAAEQKKVDYWKSILNAPMTESEKKDVAKANARMQRRISDIMADKAAVKDAGTLARLDKELKDVAEGFIGQAIADINTEGDAVVISTAATIEKDMRDAGSTEKAIANVLSAIQEGYEPRGIFDPTSGAIFFIADYNTDVAEARTTFIHERQHKRTREAGLADVLIDRLGLTGKTEEEKKAVLLPELAKLIGTRFYDGKTAGEIADEIISYSVEHEFNGDLEALGVNENIFNFAKNIDNERGNENGIPESGRTDNGGEAYRVADQRDERVEGAEPRAVEGEGSRAAAGSEEEVGLTKKTQKELTDKGLVMDGGVVMASPLADLKREVGYLTPNEVSPEVEAVAFSIRTKKAWADNYRKYPDSEERVIRSLENLAERMAADELVSGVISQGDYKYGKKANGSFAGPLRTNIEYVVTFDMDTTCPRTFQYLNYVKQIEKRIGRPLTQTECIQLTEMMRMYGQQIPCVYCYSENKRQAMKQYYTDFMTARQAVLNAATDEEALEHMYGHGTSKAAKESKDPAVVLNEAAYKVFQQWRAQRNTAYNPSLKMLWYQYSSDRNTVLSVLDQLLADGRIMTDLNDDVIAALVDTELRINDKQAIKVVEDIVSEWKWDAIEGRQHADYVPVDEDEWVVDPRTLSLWREMTAYAKSASQAKSVLRYVPYTDELKKLSQEQKDYINGMGGVRMHSSNDFRIDYVFDYFQFMADMAANKMFGHTYTKSPEFVRIFGNSGYKINMSIAAYEDENGNIRMNEDEGFNWDEAKRLREAFPNAGVMLMATSDNQIQMALDSDWIDMFIPFHASSLPKAVWYNMRMWQDYSSVQNESFLNGDEMKAALIADGVEIPKKIKASEVEQMYLEHFNVKTIVGTSGKNKGKRLRPHFLPGPTVVDGQYVPGHNNDPELYKQLCMEYGVHPRFYGVKVKDAQGNTIDITEHPNYIKCIKETSRTDSPQTAIQFNFDQPSEALGGKTPIEYAFDELQVRAAAEMQAAGAPVRDIYKSLEKDTFGIVPQFIDTIIKHKETTGKDYPLDYLTPDSRKWFLTERKALEEAYKDVETIPYHRNEYDVNGEPMMRVTGSAEDQAEIQQALDLVNGVKTFQEEGGDVRFSIRTKPAPKNTGIGYKVFFLKDGKLYPPMVANPEGADTPVGVWLDADAAPQAGTSKTGRRKVKAGGKGTQGGSGMLAYRPGWHLGEIPYALQFNRGPKVENPLGITGKNGKAIKVGKYFPANFVWAEVEYAKDVDYQDEAMSYGYNEAGNFQHSLAGLPKVPEDGSYTYRTNANPATDPWIITGAMKVNRILSDSEVDELVSKAGREPQVREDNPKAFEGRMALVNAAQKQANGNYPDSVELDDVRFRLSNNSKAIINKWFDKWADAAMKDAPNAEAGREALEPLRSDIINFLDKFNEPTMQLAWAKWFFNGSVRIGAEDMPKVRQAIKIAKAHKVDPLQFDSPMSIINQWPGDVKEDPINPDEVPTLHKAKELSDGIVIYDVDETDESRKWMREIINTHFGKDCSPWCLLQGDGNGKLTKQSASYWYNTYTAYTKQVAFKNGKLLAFSANSSETRLWWDRQDCSHFGIPVIGKIKGDKLGRSATMEYSPEDGSLRSVTDIVKGNKKDGKYMEWFSLENETPRLEETFEHGYLVGRRVINYENGQIRKDENYEKGSLSGRAVTYFDNGQIETDANYVSGRLEGPFASYHENGQVYYAGTYESGDKVGRWQTFYKDGQLHKDEVYDKFWKPLESVVYYPNGSKELESHSVSRPYGFGTVSEEQWDEQGRLVRSERMMPSSASHGYSDRDIHELTEIEYNEYGATIKRVDAYQGQRSMTLYSAIYINDVLQKQIFKDRFAYNYNDVLYDEWYTVDGKLGTVTVQKYDMYDGEAVVDQLKYKYDENGDVTVRHLVMPRGLGLVKDGELLVDETRDLLPGETIPSVDQLYREYQANENKGEEETPAPPKEKGKSIKDTVDETLAAANLYMDEDMGGDISIGGTVNGEEYSFIVFDDYTYEDFLANGYTEDELGRATPEQEEAYAKVQDEIDYYQTNGYWRDEAEDDTPMFRVSERGQKLFQDAKDEFGTTRDFREAGYLLPDGSMLDFSEKNNGGEPGRRGADHRDIARVINDRNYDTMTEYLDDFINEGAVRLIPESAAFSIAQQPTKEQKDMLRSFIYRYNGEVEVEIYKDGHSVADPYYRERTSSTRVLNDIDAYFKDGTIPEGNAPMFRMVEITPETREEMDQIEAIARMNGTYLKAPNGADTKLNPEQWSMVRTKAFKNWFGDWENDPANASKVVDENGEPAVMYHGTPWNPNEEKPGKAEFKSGWFTGMKRRAEGYGEPVAVFINIKNPAYSSEKQGEFAPIPGSFDLNDTSTFGEYDGYISFSDYPETPVLSEFARRRIQMRNPDNYEEVIAQHLEEMPKGRQFFSVIPRNSNQIKSATNNNGSFDPNDPDIRYRVTPKQDEEYRQAYEAGDEQKAIEMISDAFLAAYPNNKLGARSFYKGKNGEWENQIAGYFTDDFEFANHYGSGDVKECFLVMENPYEYDFKESGSDGDFEGLDGEIRETRSVMQEADAEAKEKGLNPYDGYILRNVGEGYGPGSYVVDDYIVKDPKQVKSAEPFTFDDNGELIPLSQRFNPESDDVRFRMAYHGAGSKFDNFDLGFAGNGVGENAHGYGVYITENQGAGERYAEIARRNGEVKYVGSNNKMIPSNLLEQARGWIASMGSFQEAKNYFDGRLFKVGSNGYLMQKVFNSMDASDWEMPARYLYEVEIPDDNGANYIDEDGRPNNAQYEMIGRMLSDKDICEMLQEIYSDSKGKPVNPGIFSKSGWQKVLDGTMHFDDGSKGDVFKKYFNAFANGIDGKHLYSFCEMFASDAEYGDEAKAISKFLNDAGFSGIKYTNESDGQCYVIFNPEDAKIVDGVSFRVSPEQDQEYRQAYENNDTAKAEQMVKDAAERAGYTAVGYHGTIGPVKKFGADRNGNIFFAAEKDAATAYALANAEQAGSEPNTVSAYLDLGKVKRMDVQGENWDEIQTEWEVSSDWDGYDERFDNFADAQAEALKHKDAYIDTSKVSDTNEIGRDARKAGYDSVIIENVYDRIHESYKGTQTDIILFNPRRIKSADPFTFDGNGNLIPLSERFNTENDDIRFRIIEPKDIAAYNKAAEDGDVKKMKKLLVAAAKEAMPNTKVVDKKGNPIVVYHGTPSDYFNEFRRDYLFFSKKQGNAAEYEGIRTNMGPRYSRTGHVMPVFLNIENPLEIDVHGGWNRISRNLVYDLLGIPYKKKYVRKTDRYGYEYSQLKDEKIDTEDVCKLAKEHGYDGVIFKSIADHMFSDDYSQTDIYVAFSSSQVKSTGATYGERLGFFDRMYRHIENEFGATRDDEGNVIPLDKRFDMENDDIRFRVSEENTTFDGNGISENGLDGELPAGGSEGQAPEGTDYSSLGYGYDGDAVRGGEPVEVLFRMVGQEAVKKLPEEERLNAQANLEIARQMKADGKSAQAILDATGWQFGKDGNPRLEEPDFKKEQVGTLMNYDGRKGMPLVDLIDDERLFTEYPELKEWNIGWIRGYDSSAATDFNNKTIIVGITKNLKAGAVYMTERDPHAYNGRGLYRTYTFTKEGRKSLLHEIQHIIQHLEGFAPGSSAEYIARRIGSHIDEIRANVAAIAQTELDALNTPEGEAFSEAVKQKLGNETIKARRRELESTDAFRQGRELFERFVKDYSFTPAAWGVAETAAARRPEGMSELKALSVSLYMTTSGEVEARTVEKRMDLKDEKRRSRLFSADEDAPRMAQWNLPADPRFSAKEDVMFRIGPAAEMKKKGIADYLTAEQMTDFTDRMLEAEFTPEERAAINDRAFEMGGDYSIPVLEHFARLAEKDNLDAHDTELIEKARQSLVDIIGAKDETFDKNDMLWVAYDAVHGDEEGIYNQVHNRKVKRSLDEAASVAPDLTLSDFLERAAQAKDDLIAQYTALRELARNLTNIMDALAARRDYDRVTVGKLVGLTDDILASRLMDEVTNGEIKRLTSIIRRANGMRDIQSRVNELYNLILSNNLRRLKALFKDELKKKAVKLDSNRVVKQGALDINGQIAMSAMKENLDSFTEDASGNIVISQSLADKIADALGRASTEEDAESIKADMELLGLTFARDYINGVVASEKEEQQLRDAMKQADEAHRKGEMSDNDHVQFIKELSRALAECRTERVGAFTALLQKMQDLTAASHELALMMNEKDKQRIEQIHHDANSDMQGVPSDEHPKDPTFLQRLSNNPFTQFFFRPLATFDQMLRLFGNKSVNGEGYLWNRFMRGWIDATGREYKALQAAYKVLDDKVSEVFGRKMRWSDLYSVEDKMPKATVRFFDGGEIKEHELTQGNLLYIMLADQMTDGRMKLRAMGISEEDVDAIRSQMDSRFMDLAEWIVNEFLPSRREAYNEVYERMFGASMSKVQNYFPLKVLSNARVQQVDVASANADPSTPSTVTGSIMRRTRNALALDVMGTDAFSLVIEHVQKMEHWAAFAEWNRDLSDLLSYKHFRNQVQNMTSIYGSQRNLWTEFVDTAMIAAGSYQGKSGKLDPAFNRMAKGVTAAKISLRVFTAIKQFLSFPAYFSEANPIYLAEGFVKGWNWSMDNLPLFEKRWKSRQAGDHILAEGNLGKINEYLARIGMTPNALVDAFTVSIGAYAIYKTKYDKYIRMGFSPEAADKRAKQDAVILYNETQQSSEAAFMSSMQSGRSTLEKMFTVFRNSSMGYQRQVHDALRNYKRRLTPGYRKDSIEFMTKQLIREGLTDRQAMKAAKGLFSRQGLKDMTRLMIFGYGLQFFWSLAPYLPYLLFGDDDDKKKEMLVDAAEKGVFGSLEGLTGGNLMSEAGNLLVFGEGLNDWDPSLLPLVSDFTNLYQEFGKDNVRAMNDLLNLGIQMGIGVNPQTLEDAVVAIIDACNGDLGTAKEAMLLGLRLISAPQTSLDQLYLDEIDMPALEAKDLTIPELAERYAKYKKSKGAGAMAPLYDLDSELDAKITEKYMTSFENKAKERLEGLEKDGRYAEITEEAKAMDARVKDLRMLAKAGDEDAERELMEIFLSDDFGPMIMFNELAKDVKTAIGNAIAAPTREEMAQYLDQAESLRSSILENYGNQESSDTWFRAKYTQYTRGFLPEMARLEKKYSDEYAKENPKYQEWMDKHQQDLDSAADKAKANAERVAEIDEELKKYEIVLANGRKRYFNQPARKKLQEEKKALREEGTTEKAYLNKLKKQEGFTPEDFMPPAIYNSPEFQTYLEFKSLGTASGNKFNFKAISEWETKMNEADDLETKAKYREKIDERMILLGQQITRRLNGVDDEDDGFSLDPELE